MFCPPILRLVYLFVLKWSRSDCIQTVFSILRIANSCAARRPFDNLDFEMGFCRRGSGNRCENDFIAWSIDQSINRSIDSSCNGAIDRRRSNRFVKFVMRWCAINCFCCELMNNYRWLRRAQLHSRCGARISWFHRDFHDMTICAVNITSSWHQIVFGFFSVANCASEMHLL